MGIDYEKYGDFHDNYHNSQRPDMLRFLPEEARIILEVGCGEGGFGELIKKQRDAEVWGIELFPKAAEKARYRLDRVFVGNIETDRFDLPEEYFDCIVFNDVLEHLYDPWDVLKRVKILLKNNGYVLASIPNIRYYGQIKNLVLKGEWEYENWGLMDRTHLRFFTLKSMRKMFEQCAYSNIRIEGIHNEEFPWKFNLLNKLLGNRLDDMRYLQYACLARNS
jgi:2-polyprenyl-3-methyl-5-hydroxy-6-metoxy-1,4-benzoquinol methylase